MVIIYNLDLTAFMVRQLVPRQSVKRQMVERLKLLVGTLLSVVLAPLANFVFSITYRFAM